MSDFEKYLAEQLKDPEFKAMWDRYEEEKAESLYIMARGIKPARALKRAMSAATKEEKAFWVYVSNMNLQCAQKNAIEKNLF